MWLHTQYMQSCIQNPVKHPRWGFCLGAFDKVLDARSDLHIKDEAKETKNAPSQNLPSHLRIVSSCTTFPRKKKKTVSTIFSYVISKRITASFINLQNARWWSKTWWLGKLKEQTKMIHWIQKQDLDKNFKQILKFGEL